MRKQTLVADLHLCNGSVKQNGRICNTEGAYFTRHSVVLLVFYQGPAQTVSGSCVGKTNHSSLDVQENSDMGINNSIAGDSTW